jgi:hypothetical protein
LSEFLIEGCNVNIAVKNDRNAIEMEENQNKNQRSVIIKHALLFQGKLALDAVRDLLLSPVSIVCLLIDVINNNNLKQSYFGKLMSFGHQTDRWLNLFNQQQEPVNKNQVDQKNVNKNSVNANPENHEFISSDKNGVEQQKENEAVAGLKSIVMENNIDHIVNKIEDVLKEQLAKGDLTASAKSTVSHYLQTLSLRNKADNSNNQDNDN